jgi:pilus assembly protein CpaE
MSQPSLIGRRVLVIGQGLVATATEALGQAALEFGGPERLLEGAGGPDPELVLIDAECAPSAVLSPAIEALGRRRIVPAAILIGENMPTAAVRALLRLPRSDVLEAPFTSQDLTRMAGDLLAVIDAVAAQPAASRSKCWTVMGAVGGSGATTVAIEISSALSRTRGSKSRVCLVDLNLADGQAAAYLGAMPNLQLGQASAAPDRIDASLLDVFAAHVTDRLHVLAAPRDPRAFERIQAHTLLRLLDVACQAYDWVIVDMPRLRQPWTLDVLGGSDELMIISELTVPALISARALADELEAELTDGPIPRIVLNRLASRVFGPAPSMTEAERALGRKADGAITSDWEAAAASVNLGGPISQHRPKSKIVRDIEVLAERLAAGPAQRTAERAA